MIADPAPSVETIAAEITLPRAPRQAVPLYRRLYCQVLVAIAVGAALGYLRPDLAQQMKPLGDVFIKLIRMMIEPIIFTTVVVGVAKMGSMKDVGRVGLKSLAYFEVVSGVALLFGFAAANLYKPGAGVAIDLTTLESAPMPAIGAHGPRSTTEFLLHLVPDSIVGAFAQGATLQVVLFSVMLGMALSTLGPPVRPL